MHCILHGEYIMNNATITLIIIGVMCVMYIVDRFPVALVTLLGMLAMIYSGVLPFQVAFSNFGSTPVLLTAGMVIIIDAIIESGVIVRFEHVLQKLSKGGEKLFGTAVLVSAGIISMFTNNSALVVMFMPFIASLSRSTKGKITKKHIYLPLAVGGLIGGTGTLAGSTAPLLANEVLEITGQKRFEFFTTAPVALSVLLVVAVCYFLFLYDLSVKWFDFDEVETTGKIIEGPDLNLKNAVISLCVFAVAVVCFILRPFGWDLGIVIYFTVWLNLAEMAQFAGIVYLIVVITQTGSGNVFLYAYHRIVDTMIGLLIGELVNRVHLPRKHNTDILFASGVTNTIFEEGHKISGYSLIELNRLIEDGCKFTVETLEAPASALSSTGRESLPTAILRRA